MKAILKSRNTANKPRILFERLKELSNNLKNYNENMKFDRNHSIITRLLNFPFFKNKFIDRPFFQNLKNICLMRNKFDLQYACKEINQINYQNFDDISKFSISKFAEDKNNINKNNQNLEKENIDINFNSDRKNENEGEDEHPKNDNEDKNNFFLNIMIFGTGTYLVYKLFEKRKESIKLQEFLDKITNNSLKKIGLVFCDDNSNKVNIYGVDINDNIFELNEEYDKENFLKKIENSKSELNKISLEDNQTNNSKNSDLKIVYEHKNNNNTILFLVPFGLLILLLIKRNKKLSLNEFKKGFNAGSKYENKIKEKINKEELNTNTNTKNAEKPSSSFEKLKKEFDSILKKQKKNKEVISTTKFSDVAGLHNTKQEVKEFVDFLSQGEKYEELGARIPRGALFTGPPGTGKTLLAKAIAGEADVNFYYSSGSEYQTKYVGEGASKIRKLFNKARDNAPSIIFIDEIDSIGKKRDSFMGGIRDDDGVLNQLLVEMDGFSTDKNVIIFGATNRSEILDSALLRSGRFDRKIEFTSPNIEERQEILKLYLNKIKLDFEEKIDEYAKRLSKLTANFSGADLRNLVNEAAIISARESKNSVDSESFEKSFDRVYFGIEKKKPNSKKELNHISFYESAKVVCSWFLENVKPIIRVSILPKTKSKANLTSFNDEKSLYTTEELFNKIVLSVSGRVAEELFLKSISTFSADDLKNANNIAEKMLNNLGMGELGNVTKNNNGDKNKSYIDEEIKQILRKAQEKSKEILIEHKNEIYKLQEILLQKENLDYLGIKEILGPLQNEKEEPCQSIVDETSNLTI